MCPGNLLGWICGDPDSRSLWAVWGPPAERGVPGKQLLKWAYVCVCVFVSVCVCVHDCKCMCVFRGGAVSWLSVCLCASVSRWYFSSENIFSSSSSSSELIALILVRLLVLVHENVTGVTACVVSEAVLFPGSSGMRRSASSRCLSGILSPLSATSAGQFSLLLASRSPSVHHYTCVPVILQWHFSNSPTNLRLQCTFVYCTLHTLSLEFCCDLKLYSSIYNTHHNISPVHLA